MSDLYINNAKSVGVDFDKHGLKPGQPAPSGSTDMGNVSHEVPSIHVRFYMGTTVPSHTREFAEAAGMTIEFTLSAFLIILLHLICFCLI